MTPKCWQRQQNGLLLRCHIQPGARRNQLIGMHDGRLKIQLKAPPIDGKANAMLTAFLADVFPCSRAQITITHGIGSRKKTIQINGVHDIPEQISRLGVE